MAVILYPSGVLRDLKPKEYTFTDQEILSLYEKFDRIRTKRLFDIPNSWMVWGEIDNAPADTFSNIGSSIAEENVYSPIMFIHDTEINPAWMITDDPILFQYNQFVADLRQFIDNIARDIIQETRSKGNSQNLVILTTIGPTSDNRVLFDFYPKSQSEEFWKIHFTDFAEKTIKFLLNHQQGTFRNLGIILFEDRKIVMRILHDDVEDLLNKLILFAEKQERYEWCAFLNNFIEQWKQHRENVSK